jgi:hypothetical protein
MLHEIAGEAISQLHNLTPMNVTFFVPLGVDENF